MFIIPPSQALVAEILAGEMRSPTAMLDQLKPFWPGSLWMPIVRGQSRMGREGDNLWSHAQNGTCGQSSPVFGDHSISRCETHPRQKKGSGKSLQKFDCIMFQGIYIRTKTWKRCEKLHGYY